MTAFRRVPTRTRYDSPACPDGSDERVRGAPTVDWGPSSSAGTLLSRFFLSWRTSRYSWDGRRNTVETVLLEI